MQSVILLIGALSLSSMAQAAPDPVSPPADMARVPCELHVWPAPGLESVTEGWIRNQTRNEALREGNGDIADTLAPQAQLDMLAALDLPARLDLGPVRVVTHSEPLPASAPGSAVVRHAPSTAACYAELVVRRLVYGRNALAGGALQGFFTYREFGASDTPSYSFTSMSEVSLREFLTKNQNELGNARAELRKAFEDDANLFFQYSQRSKLKQKK